MILDAVASILELEAENMTSDACFSLLGIKFYIYIQPLRYHSPTYGHSSIKQTNLTIA